MGPRLVAVVAAATVAACGGDAPERPRGRVAITVSLAGASPAETEQGLTRPIEQAVVMLPGVRAITSSSREGLAVVWVEPTGVDPAPLAEAIRAALEPTLRDLPADATPPMVTRVSPTAREARFLLPRPDRFAELRATIERIAGVGEVRGCGEPEPRLDVTVDPPRLAAAGATIADVVHAIEALDARSPDDLGAAVVRQVGAVPVRVLDVAVIAATAPRACVAMTAPEGMPVTVSIDGPDPARTHALLAAAARDHGIDLVELASPRVVSGTVEFLPGADDQLHRVVQAAAAIPGVDWIVVERDRDATRARLAIGLGHRVDAAAVDGAMTDVVRASPGLADLRLAGAGLGAFEVTVRGPDLDALRTAATAAVDALRRDPAITAAGCDPCTTVPRLEITLDRPRAADLGVSAADVATAIRAATTGIQVAGPLALRVEPPGTPVWVKLASDEVLTGVTVATPAAGVVPITEVVTIARAFAPAEIRHEDRERAIVVWARGPDRRAVERAVRARLPGASPRPDTRDESGR